MLNYDLTYIAAIYLRLSKEDGDFFSETEGSSKKRGSKKNESDSIHNQRELIREYLSKHPEITLYDEYIDDGYTGTNFDRPNFNRMMDDIRAKKINCVIVKDLSRFGRDYIDSGKYIEKIFPQLGVRFIALNDQFDSAAQSSASDIIVPFKNLVNDSYSRDTSIKVRSHLEVKRRQGEFISNFAVYGYMKDPEDKNHLVVDDNVAEVVRDIYRWKIEGLNPDKIAERLNAAGTLSPMEYKRSNGSNYKSAFKTSAHALWSHVAVRRILTNEIYTGVLVQGKRSTPNYKVKQVYYKEQSDWTRVEETHDAIIPRTQFDLVQQLLKEDTRACPDGVTVYPYSGRIFCGDCGSPAVRKSVKQGAKQYAYYVCSANKADKTVCSNHRISEQELDEAILATVQAQIRTVLDMDQALQQIEALSWEKREVQKIETGILLQQEIIEKNSALRIGIYEDMQDGVITKEEFLELKKEFTARISESEKAIARMEVDKRSILSGFHQQQGWLAQFREYENIREISRSVVVHLISRINLFEGQEIEVVFKQRDQFEDIMAFIETQHVKKRTPRLQVVGKEVILVGTCIQKG